MENEALLRVIMASLQNHPQKTTWFFWGRGGIGGGFISLRFPLTWAAEVWVAMHETGSFKLRVGQFSEFSCFRLPEISFTVDHQYLFWRWTKLLLGLSSRRKIKPAKVVTAEIGVFQDWSNPKTIQPNSWYFTGCPLMVLYWFRKGCVSLWISLCLVWQEHAVILCTDEGPVLNRNRWCINNTWTKHSSFRLRLWFFWYDFDIILEFTRFQHSADCWWICMNRNCLVQRSNCGSGCSSRWNMFMLFPIFLSIFRPLPATFLRKGEVLDGRGFFGQDSEWVALNTTQWSE